MPNEPDISSIREAVRELLLPVAPQREDSVLLAVRGVLQQEGVDDVDGPEYIRLELDRCRQADSIDGPLKSMVESALAAGDDRFGALLSARYVDVHDRLRGEEFSLNFLEASALLSHGRVIALLASEESMSAAQIARVLEARDRRAVFGWRPVQKVLERLGLAPSVSVSQVQELYGRDEVQEEAFLADADAVVSRALLGSVADQLGFADDLPSLLRELYREGGATFWPYLQILHYQCVIVEFYDHPASVLYEFKPRGNAATWIFDRWVAVGVPTQNPVLNNAKATDKLDLGWASSRQPRNGDPAAARALVRLVEGLGDLGFLARRELAAWLRRWLLRVIRLSTPVMHPLPERPTATEIERVLQRLSAGESATAGVVEQRLVDALTAAMHADRNTWRERGLGDSVNASNLSRKKLGDCEFQDAASRRVVAYEAHGGRLTPIYVEGHIRSLRRGMSLRVEEWEGIADRSEWQLETVFLAHDFVGDPPPRTVIEGVPVTIKFESYSDFVARAPDAAALLDQFEQHVHGPLNSSRTPDRVREAYLDWASA